MILFMHVLTCIYSGGTLEGPAQSYFMKARAESENWVQSLRTLIKDSHGAN